MMPLPRRQRWFLAAMAGLSALLLLSGLWEYWIAGAVHELVCGSTILFLTLLARRIWARAAIERPV